jgi:hypothetical protein
VTIDANAAIDSNRYADPIKTNGRWVEQIKLGSGAFNGPETMSYEFRGATANGMLKATSPSKPSRKFGRYIEALRSSANSYAFR